MFKGKKNNEKDSFNAKAHLKLALADMIYHATPYVEEYNGTDKEKVKALLENLKKEVCEIIDEVGDNPRSYANGGYFQKNVAFLHSGVRDMISAGGANQFLNQRNQSDRTILERENEIITGEIDKWEADGKFANKNSKLKDDK